MGLRKRTRETKFKFTFKTAKQVEKLQPREKPYWAVEVDNGGVATGLYLRVYPTDRKTWIYRYTLRGKERYYRLGDYDSKGYAEARTEFDTAQIKVGEGEDIAESRVQDIEKDKREKEERERVKAERDKAEKEQARTVGYLADRFMKEYAIPELKEKTVKEYRRELGKICSLPRDNTGRSKKKVHYFPEEWKDKPLVEVEPVEIRELVNKIREERGKVQGNRFKALLGSMFTFAQGENLREDNPVPLAFPKMRRGKRDKETRRTRVLSDSEIRGFWSGIEKAPVPEEARRILKLSLVTLMRVGEVAGAEWKNLDLDGRTLTLPDTKGGREHKVHLTDLALGIIGEKKESGYIFPRFDGKPVPVEDLSKHVRRHYQELEGIEDPSWTPHDLRRTARTRLSGLPGVKDIVIEKILNHADNRPESAKAYDLYDYRKEMKQAWEEWSKELQKILKGKPQEEPGKKAQGKVIPFPGGA